MVFNKILWAKEQHVKSGLICSLCVRIECCFKCFYCRKIHVHWKRLENNSELTRRKWSRSPRKKELPWAGRALSGQWLAPWLSASPWGAPPHRCHLTVLFPQDMIHIADTKVARRYGDFFIRQIHKFEEVRGLRVRGCGLGTEVGNWVRSFHFYF